MPLGTQRKAGGYGHCTDYWTRELSVLYTFGDIIGDSPVFRRVVELARLAADSCSTVLLLGETGTGKEMFAHAIHNASARRAGPFVAVNCGAIPRELVESELFGYADGAFTGARRGGTPGKFELANRGTLFLDEIGEMPLDIQAVLLRVLQDGQVVRIGSQGVRRVDVRVIASTNKDLAEAVAGGSFRRDLYFRLNVFTLVIPPLRERREDIPLLARHFIAKMNRRLGTSVEGMTKQAVGLLLNYDWPGNVRELENVIEFAVNLARTGVVTAAHLAPALPQALRGQPRLNSSSPGVRLGDVERCALAEMLERTGGNVSEAARRLGIARSSLYRKMGRYGIAVQRTLIGTNQSGCFPGVSRQELGPE